MTQDGSKGFQRTLTSAAPYSTNPLLFPVAAAAVAAAVVVVAADIAAAAARIAAVVVVAEHIAVAAAVAVVVGTRDFAGELVVVDRRHRTWLRISGVYVLSKGRGGGCGSR